MLTLRDARPEDALSVARVHVRSWQVAYRGLLPHDYLDALRPEDRMTHYDFGKIDATAPATIVAAFDDNTIVGFATAGPSGADTPMTGELMALYVEPDAWGRGVGRRLIEEARARLHRSGFTDALLWVLVGNERAAQFYRRDGWSTDDHRRTQRVWGVLVDEIRFRRRLE
jgi:GNAT superfamily N-acetyltransferase